MSLKVSDRTAWPAVLRRCVLLATVLSAGGCATTTPVAPPAAPAALQPPAAEQPFLEARGSGVQIYECAAKPGQPTVFEWTFRAPEAALLDASGHALGKHYAGPTWEATDGSSVVGEVKARDPGPTATAIPWLLLAAKSTTGAGVFGKTTSIQRVPTVGGIAPAEPCNAATAAKIARVPYTARYYFYRAHR
jgi:FtsP/CotA-like multicopper oxidase with cupredoxin domain